MFYMQRVTLDDICVKITKTHSFKAVNDISPEIMCSNNNQEYWREDMNKAEVYELLNYRT